MTKWLLLVAGVGVAYFAWKYPYACGALVKYPSQLNEVAKQLSAASDVVSSIGGLVDTAKADWASIENAIS